MEKTIGRTVLLVSGSYPPDICGVGDYTKVLYNSITEKHLKDLKYGLFYKKYWSFKFLFSYLKEIKSYKADIIHMQYPTEGYGYSFLPIVLMAFLRQKIKILTLHELSNRTAKARVFSYFLMFFFKEIIVTNNFEAKYINNKWFFKHKKTIVINIGSNIPKSIYAGKEFLLRQNDFIYFGHLRPLKGLENFIDVVKALRQKKSTIKCAIVGQVMERYRDYFNFIKKQADLLDINLLLDKNDTLTADALADSKIIYLPFPDGVSFRRGSLMAAVLNNCSVITTVSQDTPTTVFFNQYCYLTETHQQVQPIIQELLVNSEQRKDIQPLSVYFSWNDIAEKHCKLYKEF